MPILTSTPLHSQPPHPPQTKETIKNYDDVEYKKSVKEAEARAIDQAKWDSKSKIERRVAAKQLDPTKWKLKGAAKPAQVRRGWGGVGC